MIATAFCLRAPFTCVGPLADVIQSDLGISSGAMGTITTIPLLMFAAFSVVMGDLGRRHPAYCSSSASPHRSSCSDTSSEGTSSSVLRRHKPAPVGTVLRKG